jgi:hypothetical protein
VDQKRDPLASARRSGLDAFDPNRLLTKCDNLVRLRTGWCAMSDIASSPFGLFALIKKLGLLGDAAISELRERDAQQQ